MRKVPKTLEKRNSSSFQNLFSKLGFFKIIIFVVGLCILAWQSNLQISFITWRFHFVGQNKIQPLHSPLLTLVHHWALQMPNPFQSLNLTLKLVSSHLILKSHLLVFPPQCFFSAQERGQFWANWGANSNLSRVVGICLKFQKKYVSKAEFTCKCVFYRPEWKKTQILKIAPNSTNDASQVSLKVLNALF